MRYINELLKLSSLPLIYRMFPNAKEVTETMAAFNAVRSHVRPLLNLDFGDEANVYFLGDGHQPRTAATFAVRTRWNCHSVDPALRKDHPKVKRLHVHPIKGEDMDYQETNLLIGVHSHCPWKPVIDKIQSRPLVVVSIPCCFKDGLGRPLISYIDEECLSEHRRVNIYHLEQR